METLTKKEFETYKTEYVIEQLEKNIDFLSKCIEHDEQDKYLKHYVDFKKTELDSLKRIYKLLTCSPIPKEWELLTSVPMHNTKIIEGVK